MDMINALLEFMKAIFAALTKFLGKSIPVVSDVEAISLEENTGEA